MLCKPLRDVGFLLIVLAEGDVESIFHTGKPAVSIGGSNTFAQRMFFEQLLEFSLIQVFQWLPQFLDLLP